MTRKTVRTVLFLIHFWLTYQSDCSTSSFYEPADMPDESWNDYLEEFNDMCGGSITCRRMSRHVPFSVFFNFEADESLMEDPDIMDPSISIDDAFAVWSEESADFMPPDEELAGGFCKCSKDSEDIHGSRGGLCLFNSTYVQTACGFKVGD